MSEIEDRSADSPVCLLIVLCSDVIEDKTTNNKTIVNLFNEINVHSVPTNQQKLTIVTSVTNVLGDVPTRLTITASDGDVVFDAVNQIKSENPLAVHDMVYQMYGLPLPAYGAYRVELFVAGRYLLSRTFTVARINRPPMPGL